MEIEWIGMIAGALTTCAFVPQVVKTVRSRSTGDLSWLWLVMMSAGVFLWMVYGYFVASPSVFIANIVTLFCLLALLCVKISVHQQTADTGEYVIKKRKLKRCFGCGQCEKGCPYIVEYREKVSKENDREPLKQ